jgi:hypothetical protein
VKKQKNRRYRNAKISEHRLRRVIECFAQNLTVRDAAIKTKLSEPAIASIYMRVRVKLKTNGLVTLQLDPNSPPAARPAWGPKHRGAPEAHHDLHEIEFLHRVLTAQQYRFVERLSVSDPKQWDRAMRLYLSDRKTGRYTFTELIHPGPHELEPQNHRPFDPADIYSKSVILVNERMVDGNAAFFRYLWELLLRSPLDVSG